MEIYVYRNEQRLGPFSLEEITEQFKAGILNAADLCWHEGCADWKPLLGLVEPSINSGPPPLPPQPPPLPLRALKPDAATPSAAPKTFLQYPEFFGGSPTGYMVFGLMAWKGGTLGLGLVFGALVCTMIKRWNQSPFLGAIWLMISSVIVSLGAAALLLPLASRLGSTRGLQDLSQSLTQTAALEGASAAVVFAGILWLTFRPGGLAVVLNSALQVVMIVAGAYFLLSSASSFAKAGDRKLAEHIIDKGVEKVFVITILRVGIIIHLYRGYNRSPVCRVRHWVF